MGGVSVELLCGGRPCSSVILATYAVHSLDFLRGHGVLDVLLGQLCRATNACESSHYSSGYLCWLAGCELNPLPSW